MNIKFLILIGVFINTVLFSQSQPKAFEDWKTTAGSQNFFYKNITKTDGLGNVYVAGATVNGAGNTDLLLAKYDSKGVQLWIQQYAGTANGMDFAADLAVTNTNAYLTGAVTTNTTTLLPDMVTIKYKSDGTLLWATTYNGGGNSYDIGKSIVTDASNNVYITGTSYNASNNADIATIKFNASGTQQWVKTYNHTANLDDAGYKILLEGTNVVISGAVTQTTNQYKYVTLAYAQSTGSNTATNISSATTSSSITVVTDFTTDASGNTIIVGSMYVAGQGDNMYVQKLNSSLVSAWTYTYNSASNLDDVARAVQIDASGNVYITGYSKHATEGRNITTIKLNSSGVQQWLQTINSSTNGDDEAADMVIDASSNIYIAGYIQSDINQTDYYTAKYNSSGTKLWEVQTDGLHLNDQATNIALDSLNNVIVTGQSEITPGNFQFLTTKYVQKDVITPTDFNGELPASNFRYYENKGQLISTTLTPVPDVRFYTNNTHPVHYIKNNSSSFVFTKVNSTNLAIDTLHRIDLTYDLASTSAKTYPTEVQRNGYLNYFLGQTGSTNITGVFGNQRLVTSNIYPNIDLMYSSNQNGIKYYYIVKPGGDPRNIALTFSGASSFTLNPTTNDLTIYSSIGNIKFDRPTAYQLSASNNTVAITTWTPNWTVNVVSNKYKFSTGAYTTSLTLIIEVDQGNSVSTAPSSIQNLKWSTFIGGSSQEQINKVSSDNSGNIYTLGQTYSSVYPQGNGVITVFQSNNLGSLDGLACRFTQAGELIWSTFIGGSKADNLVDVAFNSNGDLYCVGNTNSSDLQCQTKLGATNDLTFAGPTYGTGGVIMAEGYIFQLNPTGQTCNWLRYYGGSDNDALTACTMDVNNNFFITGYSLSTDIPLTTPLGTYSQSNVGLAFDGIMARFNNSSTLTWATYIGSSNNVTNGPNDKLNDIVLVDGVDGGPQEVYVAGYSEGGNYPNISTSGSSNYPAHSFGVEGVITRFKNDGQIVWSTYFGGSSTDIAYGLAYGNKKLYLTGYTNSNDFLSINSGANYFQSTIGGNWDAIFLTVNEFNVITHSTYLGGVNEDLGWDIKYNSQTSTAYVSGECTGGGFPMPINNPVNTYNQSFAGGVDNFLCSFKDGNSSMLWGTYLGGNLDETYLGVGNGEYHQSICIYNNNLYLGSFTKSSQAATIPFPLDNGGGLPVYFQPNMNGVMDATITKFDLIPVVVGLEEKITSNNKILLYPNPASHNLFIDNQEKTNNMSYKIYNTLGQVVFSGILNAIQNPINIETLNTGLYVIELTNGKTKYSSKFIKND